MRVEFHQLERRWEHLRARRPGRQRQLLASLAECGQQTPIVVVAAEGPADRYIVIDGYQRIAALQQLGRDTVEATVWPMTEAEAVLLDRTLRLAQPETALEIGWLLRELERRFRYSIAELARRFDRSTSWVARRLALVELLPEAIQQQVREGKIPAQWAMKFLLPAARRSLDDCQRMAAILAEQRCTTREAAELYAAWRRASPAIRRRILEHPDLFFKTQRQAPSPSATELDRDLEMVAAILERAQRRLRGTAVLEADVPAARQQIARIEKQLQRLEKLLPQQQQEEAHVEPRPTHHDSGTTQQRDGQTGDRPPVENQPQHGAPGPAQQLRGFAALAPGGESRTLPPADPGSAGGLPGQLGASP